MDSRIIVNGREYESVDAMPADVRQMYEDALIHFADENRNGVPDVVERGAPGEIVNVQRTSITMNGRTFDVSGPVPAFLRRLLLAGMQHRASRTGAPADADSAFTSSDVDGSGSARGQGSQTLFDSDPTVVDTVSSFVGSTRTLERAMALVLVVSAVAVLVGAVVLITRMKAASSGQGEPFYVALAAIVLLGALDTQATRLVRRRAPGFYGPSESDRRFARWSLLALVLAALLLFGLALLP